MAKMQLIMRRSGPESPIEHVLYCEPAPHFVLVEPLLQSLPTFHHFGCLHLTIGEFELLLDCFLGLTEFLVNSAELRLYLVVLVAASAHDATIDGVENPEQVSNRIDFV